MYSNDNGFTYYLLCFRQSDRLAWAYRLTWDPSWDELLSIFGSSEPVAHRTVGDVVVLSSEESEGDDEEEKAEPTMEASHVPTKQLRLMPCSFNQPPRIGHLRSASSRNVQRSITWMFQHHLMHQEIRQKALQTKKGFRHCLRAYVQIICEPPVTIDILRPANSGNAISCASNDPFRN